MKNFQGKKKLNKILKNMFICKIYKIKNINKFYYKYEKNINFVNYIL